MRALPRQWDFPAEENTRFKGVSVAALWLLPGSLPIKGGALQCKS